MKVAPPAIYLLLGKFHAMLPGDFNEAWHVGATWFGEFGGVGGKEMLEAGGRGEDPKKRATPVHCQAAP